VGVAACARRAQVLHWRARGCAALVAGRCADFDAHDSYGVTGAMIVADLRVHELSIMES